MKLSELRHRIIIESETQTPDGIGGFTSSWVTFKTVWARIEPTRGNERKYAEKLEQNITHVLTCHAQSVAGVNHSMRVNHNGTIYHIKAVVKLLEVDKWVKIDAVQGVAS